MRPVAVSILLVIPALLASQPSIGGRSGAAYRLGQTAQGISVGNARAALTLRDPDVFMNPALAPFQTSRVVALGAGLFPLDRAVQTISYGSALPPAAGIAFTFHRVSVSAIDGRDRNGNRTEELSVAENVAALSFGLRPATSFTIGITAKLLYAQMVEGLTSTTVGLDAGATYLLGTEWRIATVFRDLNSKYRWDTSPIYGRNGRQTSDVFPVRSVFAVAYAPEPWPVSVSVEAEASGGGWLMRGGLDALVHPMLRIRTGLDAVDPGGLYGSRWSAGIAVENTGIHWDPSFDYAFVVEPFTPGSAHILTIRLHISS
jgi:hypothetical protein